MTKATLVIKNIKRIKEVDIKGVVFDFDDTLVKPPIEWQQIMAEYFVCQIYGNFENNIEIKRVKRIRRYIDESAGTTLTNYMTELFRIVKSKNVSNLKSVDDYYKDFNELWRQKTLDFYTAEDIIKGIPALLKKLKNNNIKIFVITGGDRKHKVELIKKIGLTSFICSKDIFGDCDRRFGGNFSKEDALKYIHDLLVRRKYNEKNSSKNVNFNNIILAMVGDGKKDMQAAINVKGTLAVGFNQAYSADVYICGNEYPVNDLMKLFNSRYK